MDPSFRQSNSFFNCDNSEGIKFVTTFCLDLSHLHQHKFENSFQDSLKLLCSCGLDVESPNDFFLNCPLFSIQRRALLRTINNIDKTLLTNTDSNVVWNLLLGILLNVATNTFIFDTTVDYLQSTGRFEELFL